MKGQSDTDIEILRMMITEGRGGKLEQSREKRGGEWELVIIELCIPDSELGG